MTPAERRLRARIGAYSLHAQGGTNTGPARAAFNSRFEEKVDPDGVLCPQERARRARAARSAYFAQLALKSARKRRQKAASGGGGQHQAEARDHHGSS